MDNLPSGFFGIVGLFIGSFLNVCIYRLPRRESLSWPGSHCPACGRNLTVTDLVPVLSYLALRGKCRTCGAKISPRYPFIELLTGIAFHWSAEHAGGNAAEMAASMLLLSGMIVVFFTDLDHWIIPDKLLLPLALAGLVLSVFRGMFVDSIEAAAIGFLGFYAIAILGTAALKKEAMGGGDIKLAGVIGLYLGTKNMLAGFFLAFLFGALVSIPMLLSRKRGSGDPLPFGPMMALGAVAALVKGPELLEWYGDWMAKLWLY